LLQGAQRLGWLDGEEKEKGGGGLLGVGMREMGVRPGVASGAVEGGAWRRQRRNPGGGGRWSTTSGIGEVAL
jgi:hypothetical protein